MKHVVKEQYKDLELKRLLPEGAVLEEEYKKDNVELTEERISYLVYERNLCKTVEEIQEGNIKEIEATNEIPEGEQVIDELVIVPDETKEDNSKEQTEKEDKEESKGKDNAKAKDKNKNNK